MADLRQAFEYASKNPTSDFANNLKQLASSGALDNDAKKFGLDLTPFKQPAPVQKGVVDTVTSAIGDTVDKAKTLTGSIAEGMGGTLPLPVIDWAGRKIVESLPDTATFGGLTKQQMLDNLDKSPSLQSKFDEMIGADKNPTTAKVGEVAGTIASLVVPALEGAKVLAGTEAGAKAIDLAKTPFRAVRDFAVGTKDAVVDTAKTAKTKAGNAVESVFSPTDKIAEVVSSPEVHPFVAQSPANAQLVSDAVKQGFEPRDIKFLTTVGEADKPAMKEMTDLAAKGEGDLRAQYAGKRPADVVGDSILQPLREIQKINQSR